MGNSGYLLALCPLFLLGWCVDRGAFCKTLIPRLTKKRVSIQHHLNTAPRRERNKTFCYHKANYAITRHITPLSPWRGAGGEVSCRAVCRTAEASCWVRCCFCNCLVLFQKHLFQHLVRCANLTFHVLGRLLPCYLHAPRSLDKLVHQRIEVRFTIHFKAAAGHH